MRLNIYYFPARLLSCLVVSVSALAAHFLSCQPNQQLKSTSIKMFLGSFYHSVDFISLVGSAGTQVDTKLK